MKVLDTRLYVLILILSSCDFCFELFLINFTRTNGITDKVLACSAFDWVRFPWSANSLRVAIFKSFSLLSPGLGWKDVDKHKNCRSLANSTMHNQKNKVYLSSEISSASKILEWKGRTHIFINSPNPIVEKNLELASNATVHFDHFLSHISRFLCLCSAFLSHTTTKLTLNT